MRTPPLVIPAILFCWWYGSTGWVFSLEYILLLCDSQQRGVHIRLYSVRKCVWSQGVGSKYQWLWAQWGVNGAFYQCWQWVTSGIDFWQVWYADTCLCWQKYSANGGVYVERVFYNWVCALLSSVILFFVAVVVSLKVGGITSGVTYVIWVCFAYM